MFAFSILLGCPTPIFLSRMNLHFINNWQRWQIAHDKNQSLWGFWPLKPVKNWWWCWFHYQNEYREQEAIATVRKEGPTYPSSRYESFNEPPAFLMIWIASMLELPWGQRQGQPQQRSQPQWKLFIIEDDLYMSYFTLLQESKRVGSGRYMKNPCCILNSLQGHTKDHKTTLHPG